MSDLWSKQDIADYMRISVDSVERKELVKTGFPDAVMAGDSLRWVKSEVVEFLLSNRVSWLAHQRKRCSKSKVTRGSGAQSPAPAPSRPVSLTAAK